MSIFVFLGLGSLFGLLWWWADKEKKDTLMGIGFGCTLASLMTAFIIVTMGTVVYGGYLNIKADIKANPCTYEINDLAKTQVFNKTFWFDWAIPDDIDNIKISRKCNGE